MTIDREKATDQINRISILSEIIENQTKKKKEIIETMIPMLDQIHNEKTGEIVQDIKTGLILLMDL